MASRVLVVNSGSSSIKYKLLEPERPTVLASGIVEQIGEESGRHVHHDESGDTVREAPVLDHREGFRLITVALAGLLDAQPLAAIGHRVVHGGERFQQPTVLDDTVIAEVRSLVPLAPLHNPANLVGIEAAMALAPEVPHVAVFDTAFHVTLPRHAFLYALPFELYERHGVRRYGFHGTSHAFVAEEAAAFLGRPLAELRMITLHLGNGASATAVSGGRSIDTSMGLGPLEGLVMGTRAGDVDATVVFHLARNLGWDLATIEGVLNRESGLKGLCGDNDLRAITQRVAKGDEQAAVALDVMAYRLRKYLGAYAAALGGVDVVVFTAGIGEHAPEVRWRACEGLGFLGITVDEERNRAATGGEIAPIHVDGAPVAVLVVPTDEELEIGRLALSCVRSR